ncbi:MAG TPA: ATP-binding protein [Ktedonobacteraceae bacterium]|nr:ATP-binding protein [Ktedonobacteraceae bacterium]
MGVKYSVDHLDASAILAALLDEFSAVTDYRTLRDNLPRRLAGLLRCRCVLLYQRMGETLQFAAGSFADQPGWSAALLAVAHINPLQMASSLPEAEAWRTRRALLAPLAGQEDALVSTPLIYRQRAIGVLTALRGETPESSSEPAALAWQTEEVPLVAAVAKVVAMLLENTRLLERDRERIHELSLLNGMTSQMHAGLRDRVRVQQITIQRAREIARPDLCAILTAETRADAEPDAFPPTWLPAPLRGMLLRRWQGDLHAAPLILERGSTRQALEYMQHLDPRIKTFFALPLIGKRGGAWTRAGLQLTSPPQESSTVGARVHGILVGAYHTSWQVRREEQVLLQILANQASAVLENCSLMDDVIEARNEARRLLRQVLDDQRFKEVVLESIPSGLITINRQGKITTFNQAAEAVLGYHPREVLGQPVDKFLALRGLERCLQSGQAQHETLITSGGQSQEVALEVTLVPLRDERGQQIGLLATFADITSVYHLEEEKRRLDRLASLGQMSTSVAHEVRNPLAAIKTSMQMLRDDLEGTETPNNEEIAVVLKEIERLDGIVRDLLLFARPRQLHRVECDPGELCARLLHFLRPQCDERGVRVQLVRQHLPPALLDMAQMEQVLMNIFLNALQAMPDGGTLSVTCQALPSASEPTVHPVSRQFKRAYELCAPTTDEQADSETQGEAPHEARAQQAWLELVVSDTGVGIAQDALERIFQPFYTTRAHGIGLGLPITRRLVEDHQGYILVESQLGYGTTISVRLPLERQAPAQAEKHVEGGNSCCESDHPDC